MQLEIIDEWAFRLLFSGSYGGFPTALAVQDWRSYDELLKPSHYLRRFHAAYSNPAELQSLAVKSGVGTWVELLQLMDADARAHMNERSIGMPKLTPWIVTEASDEGAVLERNPYYFKVDAAGNQLPYIDLIEYTRAPDEEALAGRQFAGEVDFASQTIVMPRLESYREHSEAANYCLKLGDLHRSSGVAFLNLTYDDEGWRQVVQDVRFRQALSHAVDRRDFVEALYFGLGEVSRLNPSEYSRDLANALLDELGMDARDDAGWRLDPEGNPFSIDFECSDELYDTVAAAQLYMFYWQTVGIRCSLQVLDSTILQDRAKANALKATVHFEMSPLWFSQDYGWDWWSRLWHEWWISAGEGGEEPPEAYKAFRSKVETIMAMPPDVGRDIVTPEVGQMMYENVWYFVPTGNLKQPRIESRDFRNVISNEQTWAIAQASAMEQVFDGALAEQGGDTQ
jgi:peptide/nickel transport system substrate-binding protein